MKNRISTGTDQAELPRYKLDHQLLQQWVAGYMILPKSADSGNRLTLLNRTQCMISSSLTLYGFTLRLVMGLAAAEYRQE